MKIYYKLKIFISIILLSLASSLLSNEHHYQLYYQGIRAGKATLTLTLSDKTVEMKLLLRTNRVMDSFYKIRDTIRVTADSENYNLISLEKSLNEGKYKKKSIFHTSDIRLDSLTKPLRGEYCSIMMLMDSSYFRQKSIELNLWVKKHEIPFLLYEKHRESLSFQGRSRRTILYIPDEDSLRAVGKEKTNISIWMLDALPSIPLQIKMNVKFGNLILKYTGSQ